MAKRLLKDELIDMSIIMCGDILNYIKDECEDSKLEAVCISILLGLSASHATSPNVKKNTLAAMEKAYDAYNDKFSTEGE